MGEQMLTEDATISGENEFVETETPSNSDAAKHLSKKHKKNQNSPNDNVKSQELLVETSNKNDCQEQSTEVVNTAEIGEDACLEISQSNTCSTPSLGKRKRMEQKNGHDTLKRNGIEHDNLEISANICLKLDENENDEEPIFPDNMSTGQEEKRFDLNNSINDDTGTINNCHDPQNDSVPVPDVKAFNSTCKHSSMPIISEQLCNPPNYVKFSSVHNLQKHVDDRNIVDEENSARTYTRKKQKDSYPQEISLEINEQGANCLSPELTNLPIESRNTCLNCPDEALAPGCLTDDLKREEIDGHDTSKSSRTIGDDSLLENPLGVSSDLGHASMENTNKLEDTSIGKGSVTNVLGGGLARENYEHVESSKKNANLTVACGTPSIKLESFAKASTYGSSHKHTLATLSQILKNNLQVPIAFPPKMGPTQVNVAEPINQSSSNEQGANCLSPELTNLPIESRNTCLNCPDEALAPGCLTDDLKREEIDGHDTSKSSKIIGDDSLLENPLGVSSDLGHASMENTNKLEDTSIGKGSVTNVLGGDLARENYEHVESSKKNANLTVPCGTPSIKMESFAKASTYGSSHKHTLATLSQILKNNLQVPIAFPPKMGPMQVNVAEPINQSSSRKKLLVLDVNGLLADIVVHENLRYQPDAIISTKAVFKRPFCDDFLKFCFERFNVGVWSSRTKKNVQRVLDFLIRRKGYKLLFCWDQSHCTETGYNTIENKDKPLVLKELKNLWEKQDPDLPWERGDYDESNTLLLDDSPYKALRNPPNTAIFPFTYEYWHQFDNALAAKGHLRMYLERLADAENVQEFVEKYPFGQRPITKLSASWPFYLKIIGATSPLPEACENSSLATKSKLEAGESSSLATKFLTEAGESSSLATKSLTEAGESSSLATKSQPEAGYYGSSATKSQLEASDDGSLAIRCKLEAGDDDSSATKPQQEVGENGYLAIKHKPEAGDGSLASEFKSEIDGGSRSAALEAGDDSSSTMVSQPQTADNSSSAPKSQP